MPGLVKAEQEEVKMVDAGPALEDLFANEDITKQFQTGSIAPNEVLMGDLSNPMVMLTYYRRLCPFKQLFLWLNHSQVPNRQFTHREFAMTLANDVYIRYQSFANADELQKEVIRLNPARFEIGPVYSGRPKDRKALMKTAFKPTARELVFDIDMTDYDGVRTCCQDKAMCKRCWNFISMAVKILDQTIRDDFGFKHLLWVYSGRRGIHLWISDPAAIALTDEQRRSIVNYIEVIKGGAKMDKKVNLPRPLHPSMQRALDTLEKPFRLFVLNNQDCFNQPDQWESVLNILPDKAQASKIKARFESREASSIDKWNEIKQLPDLRNVSAPQRHNMNKKWEFAIEDIILQYTYPRIDTEVSKKQNHLLKSPFCVHPGTGRVCVPLLASQVDAFDPELVPTVGQLLMELDTLTRAGDVRAGWEKTSLRPYIELFESFIDGIVREKTRAVKAEKEESMEF